MYAYRSLPCIYIFIHVYVKCNKMMPKIKGTQGMAIFLHLVVMLRHKEKCIIEVWRDRVREKLCFNLVTFYILYYISPFLNVLLSSLVVLSSSFSFILDIFISISHSLTMLLKRQK
jgi:hypothetical protein